ncbi:MAG: TetR/AcrR family transcriptional regulator [Clostridiales bacterium]|nr:TetR/AcrR family transcriptional regulator [Clostridiales bacterium]
MTVKMTNRQLHALETKDAIYRAAISLFKTKGYENVLIEEITKAAHTAKGTFYIHFKSKKDLLYHTFNKFDEIYVNAYEEVKQIPTFEERFLSFIEISYREIDAGGKEIPKALYYNSILDVDPVLLQNSRNKYKIISEMVQFGIETGELNAKESVDYYLDMIKTQITGMDYRWCVATEEIDFAKYTRESMRIYLRGLKNL